MKKNTFRTSAHNFLPIFKISGETCGEAYKSQEAQKQASIQVGVCCQVGEGARGCMSSRGGMAQVQGCFGWLLLGGRGYTRVHKWQGRHEASTMLRDDDWGDMSGWGSTMWTWGSGTVWKDMWVACKAQEQKGWKKVCQRGRFPQATCSHPFRLLHWLCGEPAGKVTNSNHMTLRTSHNYHFFSAIITSKDCWTSGC